MKKGSEVIKELRKQKNFTQAQLAKESDLEKSVIAGIEKGEIKPDKKQLKAIIKALGVTKEVLQFHMIEVKDVAKNKQDVFKQLSPMIKKLSKEILQSK